MIDLRAAVRIARTGTGYECLEGCAGFAGIVAADPGDEDDHVFERRQLGIKFGRHPRQGRDHHRIGHVRGQRVARIGEAELAFVAMDDARSVLRTLIEIEVDGKDLWRDIGQHAATAAMSLGRRADAAVGGDPDIALPDIWGGEVRLVEFPVLPNDYAGHTHPSSGGALATLRIPSPVTDWFTEFNGVRVAGVSSIPDVLFARTCREFPVGTSASVDRRRPATILRTASMSQLPLTNVDQHAPFDDQAFEGSLCPNLPTAMRSYFGRTRSHISSR